MTVLVFDLDDTLYDELTYVKSGFQVVARDLYHRFSWPEEVTFEHMVKSLERGRERIFDDVLRDFGGYSKTNVRKCISVYRLHRPQINLSEEARRCLNRFESYPKYIVTDGNKIVQRNKLQALGLFERVKFCFITHRYGVCNSKPSPYCFLKICNMEKVNPSQVVYIGDNPHKDFVGIKPLGFKTIRVLTGGYGKVKPSKEFAAHYTINSLDDLSFDLLEQIIN